MIRKKILLLGDFSVGKTSLIRRYVDGSFDDKYLSTIGVKISKKLLIMDSEEYELFIWDIEGRTPVKKIPIHYYKGASGAIFVSDVNRSETIESIQLHIDIFLGVNPSSNYVVAYNKSDLLTQYQEDDFDMPIEGFFTSAKDDKNVDKIFMTILKGMID